MSTTATPLLDLIVEHMEASGRWRHVPAPALAWIDLREAEVSGENPRAITIGEAIGRELYYEGIVSEGIIHEDGVR